MSDVWWLMLGRVIKFALKTSRIHGSRQIPLWVQSLLRSLDSRSGLLEPEFFFIKQSGCPMHRCQTNCIKAVCLLHVYSGVIVLSVFVALYADLRCWHYWNQAGESPEDHQPWRRNKVGSCLCGIRYFLFFCKWIIVSWHVSFGLICAFWLCIEWTFFL